MYPINFSKKGNGPTVVLIHGFCENLNMWSSFQQSLAQDYTVYSIDLPGFGSSKLLEESFTIEDVAETLIEWASNESIEDAVWIGHSLGGYISLEVLDNAPELVAGLGLFHSSAFADSEEGKAKRDKALDFLAKHPIEKFIGPFIPTLFDRTQVKELGVAVESAMKIALETDSNSAIAYTMAMRERKDHFQLWANTEIPLLFIGGTGDSRIPVTIAEAHIEAGHHVDGYILKGVGHMGMYEAPSECLQVIKDFLLRVY